MKKPVKIEYVGRNTDRRHISKYRCYCGNEFVCQDRYIGNGKTKSCGCLQKEKARKNGKNWITHEMSSSREYSTWGSMRARCLNKNSPDYNRYGGRGIKICKRWDKFENFLSDMGKRPPEMSLDRINVDGNYSKKNCKWSTPKEQSNNTRRNKFIKINGLRKTITEWSRYFGIPKWKMFKIYKNKEYENYRGFSLER